MSKFLQLVGYNTSFIDQEFEDKINLWSLLVRGITNELSFQNKIFTENLEPKKIETQKYKERIEIEKEKKARKEKNKASAFLGGESSHNVSNTDTTSKAGSRKSSRSKKHENYRLINPLRLDF